MKFLRGILFIIPAAIVLVVGTLCNWISIAAGWGDDGCGWLFKKMYPPARDEAVKTDDIH